MDKGRAQILSGFCMRTRTREVRIPRTLGGLQPCVPWNLATTPVTSRRFTTPHPAEFQFRRVLSLSATVYGRNRDVSENHGVLGSSPGPATSVCSINQSCPS
jgi:hypothetical protein